MPMVEPRFLMARSPGSRVLFLARAVLLATAVSGAAAAVHADTEGDATALPTLDTAPADGDVETRYARDRASAAAGYAACLRAESGVSIDVALQSCGAARASYARFLPADAADLVLGCLEERLLGRPRTEGFGCAAHDARFVTVNAVEGGSLPGQVAR